MRGINKQTMLDLIIEAKRNDPETGSFAEWLAEYLAEHMPTLTPPNEWVNRVRELDELYTKLQIVTGFTAEQLLEIFAAGYTLEKPDYSKKFAEMENLAEAAQTNEPLTMEQLRKMDGEPVYIIIDDVEPLKMWVLIEADGEDIYLTNNLGGRSYYEEARKLYKFKLYRRPPEGEANA